MSGELPSEPSAALSIPPPTRQLRGNLCQNTSWGGRALLRGQRSLGSRLECGPSELWGRGRARGEGGPFQAGAAGRLRNGVLRLPRGRGAGRKPRRQPQGLQGPSARPGTPTPTLRPRVGRGAPRGDSVSAALTGRLRGRLGSAPPGQGAMRGRRRRAGTRGRGRDFPGPRGSYSRRSEVLAAPSRPGRRAPRRVRVSPPGPACREEPGGRSPQRGPGPAGGVQLPGPGCLLRGLSLAPGSQPGSDRLLSGSPGDGADSPFLARAESPGRARAGLGHCCILTS